jgi:succinyl-CoA synthetase alpha subunit
VKKQIVLEIETNGKNLDQASEQAVMDAVTKAVEATQFTVTVKLVQPAAPAPAPAAAPPKA